MKKLGLIGFPLSHSFSESYFTEKFKQEGITDYVYNTYPLESIEDFLPLLQKEPNLVGLNVTIPYKEQVIPFLDHLDQSAAEVGAVNTIKIQDGILTGYNTDVYGFESSLQNFIKQNKIKALRKGLILGTGGASKAIAYVFKRMNIDFQMVSRSVKKGDLCYSELDANVIRETQVIVNTTPLGMSPKIDSYPDILYEFLNRQHLLFDLVYNPEKTVFLKKGAAQGAYTLNGLEMLHGQAEKAWDIWITENTTLNGNYD